MPIAPDMPTSEPKARMTWLAFVALAAISVVIAQVAGHRRNGEHRSEPARAVEDSVEYTPGIVEALDGRSLRVRSSDVFSSAYVTVLSIVQGIALGTLVVTATPQFIELTTSQADMAQLLLVTSECLATLTAIIVVYYNYIWFLLMFRWAPTAWDTLIPVALGVGNILVSAAVGTTIPWLAFIALIQVIGMPSFGHTIFRSRKGQFSRPEDYISTRRLLSQLIWMMGFGAVAALLAIPAFLRWGEWVPIAVAFGIVGWGVTAIAIAERTLRHILRGHGLTEDPASSRFSVRSVRD